MRHGGPGYPWLTVVVLAGLSFAHGCSSGNGGAVNGGSGGASGGAGGSGGTTPAPDGSTAEALDTATAEAGGADGSADIADVGGADLSDREAADAAETGEAAVELTKVRPTSGCGNDPGQTAGLTVAAMLATMGSKPADCADKKCGDWSYLREYFVTLPPGYDRNRAYPLVFQGPGCGGTGSNVYPLNIDADNMIIRVGLTPPPNDIGHVTNPQQGCFDDKEGDDSVDFVFYETLYDKLAGQLCFDRNRVFVAGNSTGAWLSNEIGCRYAGDPNRPIRGFMSNGGGLPIQPQFAPTCSADPRAGFWIRPTDEDPNVTSIKYAINRAMLVNKCSIGTGFDDTQFDDFPIGGGNPANTCRKIKGCPDTYPLVVCVVPGNGHASNDGIANPGFTTFMKVFSTPPFLTP